MPNNKELTGDESSYALNLKRIWDDKKDAVRGFADGWFSACLDNIEE